MTKDEALRKVLVTLEWFEERKHLNQFDWQTQHIADIKEALAQPEMRPDEISTDELIYMSGRYDGMKQERALWELSRLGQEIEAQPEQEPAFYTNERGSQPVAPWGKSEDYCIPLYYAPQQLEQEPVDFASLLREAEEIVQSKPTWKRFIDGTPLTNDIAVWMAVFAQDVARRTTPPQRPWVGLTDEERGSVLDSVPPDNMGGEYYDKEITAIAFAIEAKLKEKNNAV